ncbi:hypothetical protein [Sphingobium subterraneum]|jgi:hypothetical protein|uniref:Uncharacterized protein n=1 Tax=Sphingobium subterraneum TaxID=627688 RepID=A0A841J531_9SPHN|nr:hypothetical protein [Sphingobium subterraneum]MBB6125452.1 hypothetical protein [Sphingobium subterraneum]
MPHSTVTPDTVFRPSPASGQESAFSFGEPPQRLSEQQQYKRLIDAEAARQGIPLAHLADRLHMHRTRLHKVIRQTRALKDELRDRLFAELGIDHVRAKFSVALLHDYTAYGEQAVFLACEGLKSFYCEVATCRRGEIQVDLRPAIIHEALRKAYEMLLSHQARVLEHNRTLQA